MSDPRMEFLKAKDNNYYPSYFRQDGVCGADQESVFINAGVIRFKPRMQKDQAVFANQWMKNIKAQQKI